MEKKTVTLETERLNLRKFKLSDAKDMFESYCGRDIVTRYLTWMPHKSEEDTKEFLEKIVLPEYDKEYTYRWAIELKETGKVIGSIDVVDMSIRAKRCTMGWVIGDDYWNKGIMTEAAKKVFEFLFEEGFVRIQSHHQKENLASGRVMQKVGMKHEGLLRKYDINRSGEIVDCDIYAIVKED